MGTQQKQILLVDDDEALARLVKSRLESVGFKVQVEGSGKSAMSCVVEHRLDLIILDINLPDMNGYQVARELRRISLPWTLPPILMLTVRDAPMDQLRGFAHGADAYLTKPFDSTELFETVTLLVEGGSIMGRDITSSQG